MYRSVNKQDLDWLILHTMNTFLFSFQKSIKVRRKGKKKIKRTGSEIIPEEVTLIELISVDVA